MARKIPKNSVGKILPPIPVLEFASAAVTAAEKRSGRKRLSPPRVETVAHGSASGRLGRPVITVNALPECLRCGACCFAQSERFVRVTGDDWARLGPEAGRVAHFLGHRAYMKMADGHCAALEIRRDAAGRAEFFCTLYARRPQICRDLARGSPECAGERARE
jgi:hypothetical protein